MALSHSPKIVTDGLAFYYDMSNPDKSWRGAPTTNLRAGTSLATHGGNTPTINNSYSLSINNSEGWSSITASGSNTNHRIAQFPYNTLTAGVNYVFSIELFNPGPDSLSIFVDGNSAYPYINIPLGYSRWSQLVNRPTTGTQAIFFGTQNQQVSQTYSPARTIYYKNYQVEQGTFATPYTASSRSNTQAIVDLTGNVTITANNLTYNPNGTFSFNGSSSYLTTNYGAGRNVAVNPTTISAWVRWSGTGTDQLIFSTGQVPDPNQRVYVGHTGGNWDIGIFNSPYASGVSAIRVNWQKIDLVLNGSVASLYVDGEFSKSKSYSSFAMQTNVHFGAHNGSGSSYSNFFNGDITNCTIYNRALSAQEIKQNFDVMKSKYAGSSFYNPATSARQIREVDPTAPNGFYWIKPITYNGNPEYVYVDFDGSVSGITDSGPWVRVRYAQDYFTRAAPWASTGISSTTPGAYSGDFNFEQTIPWITALLAQSTETRQRFESWGFGSVGWTYNNGEYMGVKSFSGILYNGSNNSNIVKLNKPAGISHGITDFNTFNNPTAQNTDPTDINDATWRVGVFYFRDTSQRGILPIRGIYNGDVDTASEQRYFPFRNGEAVSGLNSDIWIK